MRGGCLGSAAAREAAGFYPEYVSGARDGSCILITKDADTFVGCEKTCEEKANGTLVSVFDTRGRTQVGKLLYRIFEKNATALNDDYKPWFWIGLYKNVLGDWEWVNSDNVYPNDAEGWDVGQPNGRESRCSWVMYHSMRFHDDPLCCEKHRCICETHAQPHDSFHIAANVINTTSCMSLEEYLKT